MIRATPQKLVNLLCEQVAVQVLPLDALDLIVDDLQDLVGHNEVVFLPNVDEVLSVERLVSIGVQVDLDHLKLVVPWLHNIFNVESNALKNTS